MERGVVEAKVQWEISCLCKWQSQRARHISIIVKRNACSEFMLRTTTTTTNPITNNGAREQSRAEQSRTEGETNTTKTKMKTNIK